MDHDDEIEAAAQGEDRLIYDRSQLSFQSVAFDRPFKPASRTQTDAGFCSVVGDHPDGKCRPMRPSPPSVDGTKRVRALEPLRGGAGGAAGCALCQAGMRCQRPLRRRRLSVFCPPRERMRWRNPCVFFRFRFDFNVRCFFIGCPLYEHAVSKIKEKALDAQGIGLL